MNVAGPCKQIYLKRLFKEDEYYNINSFHPKKKNNKNKRRKEKKKYLSNKKTEIIVYSDSENYERDYTAGHFFQNKSILNIKIVKHDPVNKEFDFNYEIEMNGPFDYLFELRGNLNKALYMEKTEKIKNYPKHLKYTLFCNEKIRNIRKKEFCIIMILFDEIKRNGNKMYKNKQFRESIDSYYFAYSMIKWLEFKDEKKRFELMKFSSLNPIFDEDIFQDHVKIDDLASEEDTNRYSIIYLLLSLSYSYMELRHYKEAIDCLDECIILSGDTLADPYFRRCQARMCNKFSDDEQLLLALADIQKAKSIANEIIYEETYQKLMIYLDNRKKFQYEKINYLISQIKLENNKKDFSNIYDDNIIIDYCNQEKQYQMLKEMKNKYKLAVKFYTETRNEEQLQIAYKEIDQFYENYYLFKFYYKFSAKKISKSIFSMLNEEDKILFMNDELKNVIDKEKFNISEHIFFSGNYNTELYKYACEKVGYSNIPGCYSNNPYARSIKKMPIEIKKVRNINSQVNNEKNDNKLSFFLSLPLIFISMILIAFHYYWSNQFPSILSEISR